MENTYSVLNTITAAAADITYAARRLSVATTSGTFPSMEWGNINRYTKVTGVAETAQVQNITFTAANNTTYEFAITQDVNAPNGVPATFIASYTSDSTCTEQEVVDAFIAQINSQTGATEIQITATDGGASTVTLTAKTGYAIFTPSAVSNTTVSAVTTPGVVAKGTYAVLVAAGISGVSSGSTYTSYQFEYYPTVAGQMNTYTATGPNIHTLYVDQGASNFAAFNIKMNTEIMGEVNNTEFGSVTQATNITTGVTLSTLKGLITTQSATAGSGGATPNTFTVTNTLVGVTSNVRAWVVDYAGAIATNGNPFVIVDNRGVGSFDIVISNAHSANALSGALVIGFEVVTVE